MCIPSKKSSVQDFSYDITVSYIQYARGLSYIYTPHSSVKTILGHLSSNKSYVPEITSRVGFSQVCEMLSTQEFPYTVDQI